MLNYECPNLGGKLYGFVFGDFWIQEQWYKMNN